MESTSRPVSSRGKKRGSTASSSDERKRQTRRHDRALVEGNSPPPTPPTPPKPPMSLVKLIKADASVLRYFTSLQSNLESDVMAWKKKAAQYKAEATSLRRQLRTSSGAASCSMVKRHRRGNEAEGQEDDKKEKSEIKDGKSVCSNGMDSDILESTFSETDDGVENGEGGDPKVLLKNDSLAEEQLRSEKFTSERSTIIANLKEAQSCMERLGVSLVEKVEQECRASTNSIRVDQEHGGAILEHGLHSEVGEKSMAQPAVSYLRRSDVDVAADIFRSLRNLVRASSLIEDKSLARRYWPFASHSMCLPCCHPHYDPSHPAAEGLKMALKALVHMDTYCGPSLLDGASWDDLFVHDVDRESIQTETLGTSEDSHIIQNIQTGLRGRKDLVESILLSIRGEISCRWSIEDRLAHSGAESLRFDDLRAEDSNHSHEDDGGDDNLFDQRSFNYFASLIDRIMYAKLASALLQHRHAYDEAARLVFDYAIASTPSLQIEDSSSHRPMLSLCILEALLARCIECEEDGWFSFFLSANVSAAEVTSVGPKPLLHRALALCVAAAERIWIAHASSADVRLRDASRIEIAAYKRIAQKHSSWLGDCDCMHLRMDKIGAAARDIVGESLEMCQNISRIGMIAAPALSLQLSFILIDDKRLVSNTSELIMETLKPVLANKNGIVGAGTCLLSCCKAFTAIQSQILRKLVMPGPANRASFPDDSLDSASDSFTNDSGMPVLGKALRYLQKARENAKNDSHLQLASYIARGFLVLADGHGVDKIATWILPILCEELEKASINSKKLSNHGIHSEELSNIIECVVFPTVRVINLQRRADRWTRMIDQARKAQMLVVRAVACIDSNGKNNMYWGSHAFDGQEGSALDVEQYMAPGIPDKTGPDSSIFVATRWNPNDLAAYDLHAKKDEFVFMSKSESACSLSHVASWIGVQRSLSGSFSRWPKRLSGGSDFRHSSNVHSLLRISGYATGPALRHENKNMPPSPVCVILEDDAIVVDRFVDRLASLLRELPRDFHYCSLGYSRPKNAPMVEFSSNIGIPSFLWYLTGYILSQQGAEKLLGDLPVVGPVDSWIGLKMSANWDNEFGRALGVGRDPRAPKRSLSDRCTPSLHDLASILKFRAFAALVPLCSQKVASTNWRDRDTDVVCSGITRLAFKRTVT
mmetsp:Transcript_4726/g.10035  ORF Transcript_4726/g.10035 Transcript_4726/m.10035 type:complete len:1163 (+) Transcript_4726:108-3596(+)